MKAFKVHKFYVCQITGHTMIEYTFQMHEEEKCLLLPFSSPENAKIHIAAEKRGWLLGCLEKYVSHKLKVYEASQSTTQTVKENLQKCVDSLARFENLSTEKICYHFLRGLQLFQSILPFPENPSYKSSCENLAEIKIFCETELKKQL